METLENIDNEIICLYTCAKHLIKILKNYYILTIGKTSDKCIFIRLVFKCMTYENRFAFKDKNYNDIYKLLLENNNPSYNFDDDTKVIYLTYFLGSIYQKISFMLNENTHTEGVIIPDNIKIQYNYNKKILADEKIINLSNTIFNNEDFEKLCEIKMNAINLNFENNGISDLSPLKSENINYLQNLNLSKNCIKNIDVFNKLKLENLEELFLESIRYQISAHLKMLK